MNLPHYLSRNSEVPKVKTVKSIVRKYSAKLKHEDIKIRRKVVAYSETGKTADKSVDTNDFQLYLCQNLKTWSDLDSYVSDSIFNSTTIDLRDKNVNYIMANLSSLVFDISISSKSLLDTLSYAERMKSIKEIRPDGTIRLRPRRNAIKFVMKM